MNYLLLIIAIFVLLFSLRKVSMIKYSKRNSALKEAKKNAISFLWWSLVAFALIFIPYQVWILTGRSHYFDAVYIIGGTIILMLALIFFYYKCAVKFN
jgi:heme/copper-type cytochrome/quinol oxidase subunit 2